MKPEKDKKQDTRPIENKIGVINAVNSPLGFFTLVVLVIESTLGFLVYKDKVDDSSIIITGMLLLLFCLVAVVSLIAYKRPEALGVSQINILGEGTEKKLNSHSIDQNDEASSSEANYMTLIYKFDQPPIDKFILEAKEEIYILGIDLGIMVTKIGLFLTKIEEGLNLRFISMCLDEDLIIECSKFRGISPIELQNRISFWSNSFYSKVSTKYPNQAEYRRFKHIPSSGFFIIDPNNPKHGKMNVAPYSYQGFGMDEPLIHISKRNLGSLFDIYLKQYELIWQNSTKVDSLTNIE